MLRAGKFDSPYYTLSAKKRKHDTIWMYLFMIHPSSASLLFSQPCPQKLGHIVRTLARQIDGILLQLKTRAVFE